MEKNIYVSNKYKRRWIRVDAEENSIKQVSDVEAPSGRGSVKRLNLKQKNTCRFPGSWAPAGLFLFP